jgi:hypothetical protein
MRVYPHLRAFVIHFPVYYSRFHDLFPLRLSPAWRFIDPLPLPPIRSLSTQRRRYRPGETEGVKHIWLGWPLDFGPTSPVRILRAQHIVAAAHDHALRVPHYSGAKLYPRQSRHATRHPCGLRHGYLDRFPQWLPDRVILALCRNFGHIMSCNNSTLT